MSLPDQNFSLVSFVQEEMMDSLCQSLRQVLRQLPPVAQLRFLAFTHLIENPDTLKASLEIEPSGNLRLVLEANVTPAYGCQH